MTGPSRKARELARWIVETAPHVDGPDADAAYIAERIDAEVAALVHAARAMGEVKSKDPEAPMKWRRLRAALDGWSVEQGTDA